MKQPEKVDMVFSGKTPRTSTPASSGNPAARRGRGGWHRFSPGKWARISRNGRHRHQAHQPGQYQAAGFPRHSVRHGSRHDQRHPDAQGQYHEIHRGRLLPIGDMRSPGNEFGDRTLTEAGTLGSNTTASGPRAKWSSRTGSPTCFSSRCCCGPMNSGDRHAQPQRRLSLRRPGGPGRRAGHGARRQYRRPAPCSRPPTAPRPSTPAWTRSIPSSLILSGAMMLDYMGWNEAAEAVRQGIAAAIQAGIGSPTIWPARSRAPPR
jgi:hypothetical protein